MSVLVAFALRIHVYLVNGIDADHDINFLIFLRRICLCSLFPFQINKKLELIQKIYQPIVEGDKCFVLFLFFGFLCNSS